MTTPHPRTRPRSGRVPRLHRLAAALLLALAATAFPTTTASAAGVDVHCVGTFTRTFSPPVTSTPQPVTVTGAYAYGTCAVGSTATGLDTDTLTLGCVPATAGTPATETLTWTDPTGGTSTVAWTAVTAVGQTVVFTGTVTAGRHVGDNATKVTSGISYLGSVLGCLLGTAPISSSTGLVDSLLLTH
ncbi:hypothetical protein [Actinosynnema sp. NPDC020468]|uniref:hypothetical protein n=1 Tax=Actinosynnema sp. NPDC020468 TaxID=3154488 RepID=UPI0033CB4A1F